MAHDDFSDAGLARLLALRPDTLRRMASDLSDAENYDFEAACWAALEAHDELERMPGDELQRLYAAAVANGQQALARSVRQRLMERLIDTSLEPLVSGRIS